jgi:SAM-dependent methyltransferase
MVDLGCGRGRVLLAARLLGAQAEGIDLLEAHVLAAREPLAAVGAEIRVGLAESVRLEGVTHVYAAWTCFSADTRARVTAHLRAGPIGLRVIVLNHPLEDGAFTLLESLALLCSWGRVPAYIYERIPPVALPSPLPAAPATRSPRGLTE